MRQGLHGGRLRNSLIDDKRHPGRSAKSAAFACKVHARVRVEALEDVNTIFFELKAGNVVGRVVLKMH